MMTGKEARQIRRTLKTKPGKIAQDLKQSIQTVFKKWENLPKVPKEYESYLRSAKGVRAEQSGVLSAGKKAALTRQKNKETAVVQTAPKERKKYTRSATKALVRNTQGFSKALLEYESIAAQVHKGLDRLEELETVIEQGVEELQNLTTSFRLRLDSSLRTVSSSSGQAESVLTPTGASMPDGITGAGPLANGHGGQGHEERAN